MPPSKLADSLLTYLKDEAPFAKLSESLFRHSHKVCSNKSPAVRKNGNIFSPVFLLQRFAILVVEFF